MSKLIHPLVLILAGSGLGCSFDTTGPGGNLDGSVPVIDASVADAAIEFDSLIDAEPEPDQNLCVTECVTATVLNDCAAGEQVTCDLGCVDTGTPHCGQLVPSNGATLAQLAGVSGGLHLAVDDIASIDSDDGTIVIEGDTVRDGGTGVGPSGIGYFTLDTRLAVLAVDDFTMAEGSHLAIRGSRGVIILSQGAVTIEGVIDIAGGCEDPAEVRCSGPGGGPGAVFGGASAGGCGPGGTGGGGAGLPEAGGGGGGLGKVGAKGGDGNELSLGGAGGPIATCPGASAVPLRGGSGGGTSTSADAGDGGGGGGALQITSLDTISILGVEAAISAGGAGGGGTDDADGGGGGGSGGTILLEAPAITLASCTLAANGGGGGHGNGGSNGENGLLSTLPASGGSSAEIAGGAGGAGGARNAAAQPGNGPLDGAGGGGGAVGILRFNVPTAGLATTGAVLSPQESHGDLVIE